MASWCLVTQQSPDTYMALTILQRDQFLEAYRHLHRR